MSEIINNNQLDELQISIRESLKNKQALSIKGMGTRCSFANEATVISTQKHTGVLYYEPSELAIKVRSGTKLKDIQNLLSNNNQQLATDFIDYTNSTIGGAVATAETGCGRPFLGAIRDQVLGLSIINGQGQHLNFGGQVMKNVAGYDVSRLLCGSYGDLALIDTVSLKVVPKQNQSTVTIESTKEPLKQINQLAAQALPITACVILEQIIYLRLSGSDAVIAHAIKALNAKASDKDFNFWNSIANKTHQFFNQSKLNYWQLRLAANTPLQDWDANALIDWCGHQRTIKTQENALKFDANENVNTQALINQNGSKVGFVIPPALNTTHKALKLAFDPHNIFVTH